MDRLAERIDQLSPLQRAAFLLKEAQGKLEALQKAQAEPIAIVGVSCRFPGGANNPQAFWQVLAAGTDAIREIPGDRWDVDTFYDPDPRAPGKMNTRWGGFLERFDEFDNTFFGISAHEAARIDPQQRLLLELAWEALEDAGLIPERMEGSKTGVFIGISLSEYGLMLSTDLTLTDAFVGTGTSLSIAANRISYAFDLCGPSVAVDTACSSALVGVHLACQSLRSGESRCALAGGVNMILTPTPLVNLTKAGFTSGDGKCRSFDADATGYVRSEGGGIVVLKTLSAAMADNDPIYAVILGSAVNQDGHSNGLTAPNRPAQEAVLKEAYARAGVSPGKVQYVETQGTGTLLGDAIEVQALTNVLAADRPRGKGVSIGSVKTNLGHLEAAAGIAGLIKVALAIKNRTIPPSLHFRKPNPHAPFERLPIDVPTRAKSWPQGDGPALAGLSAFGFGGTNAHLVLQEAPSRSAVNDAAGEVVEHGAQLLPISAKNSAALAALARSYRDFLASSTVPDLAEICATAANHRQHLDQRLVARCADRREAIERLDAFLAGEASKDIFVGSKPYGRVPKTAFVFSDSLHGWRDAAKNLRDTDAGFRKTLEECDRQFRRIANKSLLEWLYSQIPGNSALDGAMLYALQIALSSTWRAWGVAPDLVLGIGRGEVAAAQVAGLISLEDGLKLAWQRGQSAKESSSSTLVPAISPAAPTIPLILGGKGSVRSGRDLDRAYWLTQRAENADLPFALEAAGERKPEIFLEIGPAAITESIGAWVRSNQLEAQALPSLDGGANGVDRVFSAVAALHVAGHDVDWQRLYGRNRVPVRLPNYPWQRQKFWIETNRYFRRTPETADHSRNGVRHDHAAPTEKAKESADPIGDWIYDVRWEAKNRQPAESSNSQPPAGRWLVFMDAAGVGARLVAHLENAGLPCTRVKHDEPAHLETLFTDHAGNDAADWAGIVDLRALDVRVDETLTASELIDLECALCEPVSKLVHRITAVSGIGSPKIWLVTRGAQQLDAPTKPTALVQTALWGLGRTLSHETPRFWGGLIDLAAEGSPAEAANQLFGQITHPDGEDQLAFRADKRYVARLIRRSEANDTPAVFSLRADRTYLLTGGLGGLGRTIARWMVDHGARRLILLGRTNLPARTAWHAIEQTDPEGALGRKIAAIRKLESLGVSVHLAAVDIADEEQVKSFLETFRAEGWPALGGVMHLADDMQLAAIGGLTFDQYRRLFRGKSAGAWVLHRLLAETPLDFFVLFSSAASVLPSPLMGGFGAANASLDALVHYRRALGLPAQCVNWSDWSQNSCVNRALKDQRMQASRNLKGISNEQGLAILRRSLEQNWSHAVVIPFSAEEWQRRPVAAFEADVREQMARRNPAAAATRVRPELSTPYVAPQSELERYLADLWTTALKLDRVGMHDNFFELGGDSLQGSVLLNRIQESLKDVVHPHVLFETQTVNDLAAYLRREHPAAVKRVFPAEQAERREHWDPDWPAHLEEPDVERARELVSMFVPRKEPLPPTGSKNSRAIFILSPPRSGSTLFRVMLAGHPELFAPPELELLPFETLADRADAYGVLGHAYLDGADRAIMETLSYTAAEARAKMVEMEKSGVTTKEFYRLLQDSAPGRVLVDKTPSNAVLISSLRRAEHLFEDAFYIHLLRHPCAMILSYVEYKMHQTYVTRYGTDRRFPFSPRQMGALVWQICNQNILDFLKQIPAGRHCQVRFEDLVTRPEETLRNLCTALNIEFHSEMAEPYRNKEAKMTDGTRPEHRMHGDQKFLIAHQAVDPTVADRWKKDMSAEMLDNPMRAMARALGYDDVPAPAIRKVAAAGFQETAIPRLAAAAPSPAVASDIDNLSEAEVDSLLKLMLLENEDKK